MALLPLPILAGGYTIEYLAALMQPHHKEVLYVIDSILYTESDVETCVAKFKSQNVKLLLVEHYCDEHTKQWLLVENRIINEWYFFRKDVVDALLNM